MHEEKGQTFDAFRRAKRNTPGGKRTKLYFQPLGEFPAGKSPSLEALKEIAAPFFGLPVEVLPAQKLETDAFSPRKNPFTGGRQILTRDILAAFEAKLPEDAYCMVVMTMEDLYPSPDWNFVFGEATLRGRLGVYSFARYDPAFYGETRDAGYEKLLLLRSARVLLHETGHMFSMHHCIYFSCLMNGSNHLEEADARPLHLCPVCLRKLSASVDFDIVTRYRSLAKACAKLGLQAEGQWAAARAAWVETGSKKEGGAKSDAPASPKSARGG